MEAVVSTFIIINYNPLYESDDLGIKESTTLIAYGDVKIIYRESQIQIIDDPLTINLCFSRAEVLRIESWIES